MIQTQYKNIKQYTSNLYSIFHTIS